MTLPLSLICKNVDYLDAKSGQPRQPAQAAKVRVIMTDIPTAKS